MQPVVGASTLAGERTALGISDVTILVYNVKEYGAKGDGVTDDTAAINAALTACAVGVVYFPPGAYKITSTINMKPGVAFWGNSMFTSTLVAGAGAINIVAFTAFALANAFEIRNLGFSSGGFSGVTAINLDGTDATKRISLVNFCNVYVASCAIAAYLRFCANVVIYNFFANVCNTGIWLNQSGDVCITDSKAQNGPGFGFYVEGGPGATDEGIKLVNCSTNGQAFGLKVINQEWGMVVGCSFTTCTGGPLIIENSSAWRIIATDLSAANPVAGAIINASCTNIQLSECFIALNTFGVYMSGFRNSIRGCNFVANTNVDVFLVDAQQTSVANNICDSTGSTVSIWETGVANYSNIVGNTVNGLVVVTGPNSLQTATVRY
jgi:polygalacturonase